MRNVRDERQAFICVMDNIVTHFCLCVLVCKCEVAVTRQQQAVPDVISLQPSQHSHKYQFLPGLGSGHRTSGAAAHSAPLPRHLNIHSYES